MPPQIPLPLRSFVIFPNSEGKPGEARTRAVITAAMVHSEDHRSLHPLRTLSVCLCRAPPCHTDVPPAVGPRTGLASGATATLLTVRHNGFLGVLDNYDMSLIVILVPKEKIESNLARSFS